MRICLIIGFSGLQEFRFAFTRKTGVILADYKEKIGVLLDRIESEYMNYPDRNSDMNRLNGYLSNGEFDMVEYTAHNIIEHQEQLRKAGGKVPKDIQELLVRIEEEAQDYPDRNSDMNRLNGYLSNGEFDMVEYTAHNIIEHQRNMKTMD